MALRRLGLFSIVTSAFVLSSCEEAPRSPAHEVRAQLGAMADAQMRPVALRALRRLGASAIPELVRAVDGEPAIRNAALDALEFLGKDHLPAFAAEIRKASEAAKKRLARVLGRIGPSALPTMVALLKEDVASTRAAGARALQMLGPTMFDKIVEEVAPEDADTLARVAIAIRRLQIPTRGGTGELVLALKSENDRLRTTAFLMLALSGKEPVPLLIRALEANDYREQAIRLLGVLGTDAADARPALQALRKSTPLLAPQIDAALLRLDG